jgi:hypothetical protein
MRAMRGKKANRDEPQLWAIQQLRDAGLTVCPLSGMPLADVGQPGRDALDAAFWAMLVDAVKAHEGGATAMDREHAAASSKAYHDALEQAAKPMEEVEQLPEADDEGQPERCACGHFARIGESTCNECRPKALVEAGLAAKSKEKAEKDLLNDSIEAAEAGLPKHCPCGNMSRLFRGYDDYASCNNFEDDNDATVKRYAAAMTAILTKDRSCNMCSK